MCIIMSHGFVFFLFILDKQNTSNIQNSNVDMIMIGSEFEKNRTAMSLLFILSTGYEWHLPSLQLAGHSISN